MNASELLRCISLIIIMLSLGGMIAVILKWYSALEAQIDRAQLAPERARREPISPPAPADPDPPEPLAEPVIMPNALYEQIESLRTVVPRLNTETAAAGRALRAVDDLLASLAVDVPARVPLGPSMPGSSLAYGPVDGQFRVHVVHEKQSDGEPWSACPRAVKLRAAAALPDLLDAIGKSAADMLAESFWAAATIRAVVEALP